MQLVHFSSEAIGSLDWELPPDITAKLERLPPDLQAAILARITDLVKGHLHTLIGTLYLGAHSVVGLEMVAIRSSETASMMQSFVAVI